MPRRIMSVILDPSHVSYVANKPTCDAVEAAVSSCDAVQAETLDVIADEMTTAADVYLC